MQLGGRRALDVVDATQGVPPPEMLAPAVFERGINLNGNLDIDRSGTRIAERGRPRDDAGPRGCRETVSEVSIDFAAGPALVGP